MSFHRAQTCLAFGLAMLLSQTVAASDPQPPQAAARPPYVMETRISAPRRVDAAQLTSAEHDPERRLSGAVFRYRNETGPETTITFVVYPAGDQPAQKALKTERESLLQRLQTAADQTGLVDYKVDTSGISVKMPPRPARPTNVAIDAGPTKSIDVAKPSSPKDETLYPQKPLRGERAKATYAKPGREGESSGEETKYVYLFNRHMYFVRATIIYPGTHMEREMDKRTDDLIEQIMSRFEIENIGRCGSLALYVANPEKPNLADIFQALDEMDRRNCIEIPAASMMGVSDAAHEVVSIRYEPGDWGSP